MIHLNNGYLLLPPLIYSIDKNLNLQNLNLRRKSTNKILKFIFIRNSVCVLNFIVFQQYFGSLLLHFR